MSHPCQGEVDRALRLKSRERESHACYPAKSIATERSPAKHAQDASVHRYACRNYRILGADRPRIETSSARRRHVPRLVWMIAPAPALQRLRGWRRAPLRIMCVRGITRLCPFCGGGSRILMARWRGRLGLFWDCRTRLTAIRLWTRRHRVNSGRRC